MDILTRHAHVIQPKPLQGKPTQLAAWLAIVNAAHYPDYEVCLTDLVKPFFTTQKRYEYFVHKLKRASLLTDVYSKHVTGRRGLITYARVPVNMLDTHITLPPDAYRTKARANLTWRYYEWLDREQHPELWRDVKTLYDRGAWPKAVCAIIARKRPRSRANSSLAASFWQENRALLLYALLTRPAAISELATVYLGLQDETMLYRYVTQQWGLTYRCIDPPQLHRQWIDDIGFVEGRLGWDAKHQAYRLESSSTRSYLLGWSPNRDFYPLQQLQGDVTLEHFKSLEPHADPDMLLRDITAYCIDTGLPTPEPSDKGFIRVDERVARLYNHTPASLLASSNPCNCQWFDDAKLKCPFHPKLQPHELSPCDDWAELEVG